MRQKLKEEIENKNDLKFLRSRKNLNRSGLDTREAETQGYIP